MLECMYVCMYVCMCVYTFNDDDNNGVSQYICVSMNGHLIIHRLHMQIQGKSIYMSIVGYTSVFFMY